MDKSTNTYNYNNIDIDRKEIRLIELLPGERSDPVCLRLFHVSLDANPYYEALSYVWGNPTVTRPIRVGNYDHFQVTVNLDNALRDLRQIERSTILWVDAISINQRNISERNQQVGLMRYIYQKASAVRAWLDLEIDPLSPAFVKFAGLGENSSDADLGNDPDFWAPVARISENPYWNRVWVQQEVSYAENFVIHCRQNIVTTDGFLHYHRLHKTTSFRHQDSLQINYKVVPELLRRHFPHFDDSRLVPRPHITAGRFYQDLIEVLSDSGNLEATDPRDRVYGILSLVQGLEDNDIIVDYQRPICEVYGSVCEFAIRQTKSINFLTQATLANRKDSLHLPSWVPDWSFTLKQPAPRGFSSLLQEANILINGDSPQVLHRTLKASGFCIGSIAQISSNVDFDVSNWMEQLREWESFIDEATKMQALPEVTSPGSNLSRWIKMKKKNLRKSLGSGKKGIATQRSANWRSLLRTITFVSDRVEERIRDKTMELLELTVTDILAKWHRNYSTALVKQEPYHTLFWDMLLGCWTLTSESQRLFFTDNLCFGMASNVIQSGDEVWYLHGCHTPMVLRHEQHRVTVVGPARIDAEKLKALVKEWTSTGEGTTSDQKCKMESILLH